VHSQKSIIGTKSPVEKCGLYNKLAETGVQLSDEAKTNKTNPNKSESIFLQQNLSQVWFYKFVHTIQRDNQSWIKIFTSFKLKIQLIVTHDNFLAGNKFYDKIKGAVQ